MDASRMSAFVVPSSGGSLKRASAAIIQLHQKFNKAIPLSGTELQTTAIHP